jgi:hypothetical protein
VTQAYKRPDEGPRAVAAYDVPPSAMNNASKAM